MALDLSDLDAFEASYKPRAKKNVAPTGLALDDLDAFEVEYAARLEAEKAEKQRAEELAAKQSRSSGTLGLIQGVADYVGGGVDEFAKIDPAATGQSMLGASQQALGAAVRAPAELLQQGLSPLLDIVNQEEVAQGYVDPLSRIADTAAGIQESGKRNVEEAAPRMLPRPDSLLSPAGIAWVAQQGAQSLGPMAIGALASRFGPRAGGAPFIPAGAAETYDEVRAAGGSPSEALGQALPRGGLEVAFESPVLQAAGAGRIVKAAVADILGETATEGGNIGLDVAGGKEITPEQAQERLSGAAMVGAVQGPAQTALSYPVAQAGGGIASGMEFARQKLDELRGTSVGKPDVTPPKSKTPSVSTGDIDSNIEGSISSVDTAYDTVPYIVDQKNDVTLAEGVPSIAQESAPVNTPIEDQTASVNLATTPQDLPPPAPVVERKPRLRATETGWEVAPPSEAQTLVESAAPPVVAAPPVTRSEPPATAPATTLPAPVQNAAVAPPVQPQSASEVAPSSAPILAPKTPPKPRDFRLQATQEIQAKVASDPVYRKRVTADTNLFNTDVMARAAELKAASGSTTAPTATTPVVEALSPAGWGIADTASESTARGARDDTYIRSYVRDGKTALDAVATGAIAAPESVRNMAKRLAAVSDFSDVPLSLADDAVDAGLINAAGAKAGGMYRAGGAPNQRNTVTLLSTAGGRTTGVAEVIVHELAHAGTILAMEKLESGSLKDPVLKDLLDDMKLGLTALRSKLDSGEVNDPLDKAAYAAQNVFELVATVYADPRVARRLDEAKVTIPRRGSRRGRVATVLQVIKDFVGKLLGMTPKEVETVLLTTKIREAVEGMSSRSEARVPARTKKEAEAYGTLKALAPNDPNIKQDQLVTPREKGATGIANRILDTAIMGLTPRGRASKVTQLATEQQTGIEAEYRLETELATYEMEQAFNEATKTLPQRTKELYRANMMKRLSGDKSVDLPERTKKAVDALRAMIDNRSMLLIALGAVPPKETKKLLRNIGSWLHNDYQKTRMSPAQFLRKVQDWSAGGRDVIAEMLPDLLDSMALPDEAGLDTLLAQTKSKQANLKKERDTAKKILRMYAEQWGIGANTKLDGKDGVVERLKALTKADPAKVRATAVNYANRLLDPKRTTLDTNPAGVFSRATGAIRSAMNIDDSALDKKRTKMPKWLQTLYGKYSDPAAVAIISLGEQGRILAKFRALWDFRETGLREGILKENVAGTDAESMGKQGYELLTNHQQLHYGPLENMWIKSEDKWLMDMSATMEFVGFSKDPARYLAGYMHQNTSGPGAAAATVGMGVIAAVQPVGRAFKISQVLLDHTAAVTNFVSSALFLSGGLTAPGSWAKAAAGARFSSFAGTMAGSNSRKDQITEDVKFLTRMTVLQNASLSADIRSDLIDRVDQEMEQYLPGARRAYIKAGRGLRKTKDFAARINSAGDEFSKMLMWYARQPHLAAIHPDKTEDDIRELAAEEVLQTTANWHREAPLAKALGNTMVVAPFIVFQMGMLRASYNSLGLVAKYSAMAKDGNVAAGKYSAMEFGHFILRVAGAAAVNSSVMKGATLLAAAFIAAGDDSDEEKEKAYKELEEGAALQDPVKYAHARTLLANYQLGDVQFLRKIGEDTYTYASTQRLETLPFANIWSAAKRNDADELVEIGLGYALSEVPTWQPFLTALANAPAAATEAVKGGEGPARAAAGKGAWETVKSITPGTLKRVYNQIDTPTEFSPVEKLLSNTMFTVQTLDLKKAAGSFAADYTISIGRAMDSLRDDSKKKEVYEKAGVNSVLDYTGAVEKKYTAYVKARKNVLALRGLGKNDAWIRTAIKANPINDSLSKPELNSLMSGYFIMPDFNKMLASKEEQQVKAATTAADKQKVRDLFKEYREQLSDQQALFKAFIDRDGEVVR